MILSMICDDYGLQPPHVAAGDNLNFWPVGRLLRAGGAFFIRRSFKGDRIYSATMGAYVKRLLQDGFSQEFFIEGGRSRTGKLLAPKFGMLTLEVDAWLTGVKPDGTYLAQVLPGGVLSAFGLGLALVPATIVAVQGVPGPQSGLASGLLNTSRLVGGALGLAALTTLATSHAHTQVASGTPAVLAQTDGYQLAFAVGAILCLLGALAAGILLRPRDSAATVGEIVEAEG